jgi:alpha-1,3-fucosyltransferase 10
MFLFAVHSHLALSLHPFGRRPIRGPTQWLPHYSLATQEMLETPVRVALKTSHFFGAGYAGHVPNCTYYHHPLHCEFFTPFTHNDSAAADVLWYHAPSYCHNAIGIDRGRPEQLAVVMSMESAAYYACLDSKEYMSHFDMEMTYRMCSQVPVHYLVDDLAQLPKLQTPALPFEDKLDAVVYINSNCGAKSGRQQIVDSYIKLNASIPVHAYGACSNNMKERAADKLAVFRKYKFCICMENSIAIDYLSEKLWHGLISGCVPIYLGAPNAYDFVPEREAIIHYGEVGDVASLAALLERLAGDKAAYEAKLAWKTKPLHLLSPGFQHFLSRSEHALQHSKCQLCQAAMGHRIRPRNYTTCLFNETWISSSSESAQAASKYHAPQ